MTLATVIQQVNEEKPNSFKPEKLTGFINEIEAEVQAKFNCDKKFIPYKYNEDGDVELLAPPPYDKLYKSYLKAQVDYANEEYASYQNNQAQHVSDWNSFVDWIVREGKGMNTSPTRFKHVF